LVVQFVDDALGITGDKVVHGSFSDWFWL
jgi:hypothetical protein